jgi:hypothetical protein
MRQETSYNQEMRSPDPDPVEILRKKCIGDIQDESQDEFKMRGYRRSCELSYQKV